MIYGQLEPEEPFFFYRLKESEGCYAQDTTISITHLTTPFFPQSSKHQPFV